MEYQRKTRKQWIIEWEVECTNDPDVQEEIIKADRVIKATQAAYCGDSEKSRQVMEDRFHEVSGLVGSVSYIRGHMNGWQEAVRQGTAWEHRALAAERGLRWMTGGFLAVVVTISLAVLGR